MTIRADIFLVKQRIDIFEIEVFPFGSPVACGLALEDVNS